MLNELASSPHLHPSTNSVTQGYFPSTALALSDSNNLVTSLGLSSAGPSSWQRTYPNTSSRRLLRLSKRTADERDAIEKANTRFASHLTSDQTLVLYPDAETPFRDTADAVKRLLPYHVFQQPPEDLDHLLKQQNSNAKAKTVDLRMNIKEISSALECHQRRDALEAKFRSIKILSGKRLAPDDQAILVASLALDVERSETTILNNELRNVRTEFERREKEKRLAVNSSRTVYYGSTPSSAANVPAQYYRGYPYPYTQVYGATMQASSTSTFTVSQTPPINTTPIQSAIPVQLPVASLPALHALGIVPVPVASLPPDGHPQPPAVLRGSTSNGTMLSLEINVSLLQPTQMSGLAMVLNSLMSRNSVGVGDPGPSITHSHPSQAEQTAI